VLPETAKLKARTDLARRPDHFIAKRGRGAKLRETFEEVLDNEMPVIALKRSGGRFESDTGISQRQEHAGFYAAVLLNQAYGSLHRGHVPTPFPSFLRFALREKTCCSSQRWKNVIKAKCSVNYL
jgi:hypothetical protein